MILKKIAAIGMVNCALVLLAATGAVAAGHPQGAVNRAITQPQASAARIESLDALKQQADALAAAIAGFAQANIGTAGEKAKAGELGRVVAQLQENIATASSDPGELAFLVDEFESLQGQFAQLGFGVLKRETNALTTAAKALQDEDRSGPQSALTKLATLLSATAQLGLNIATAAAQNDTTRVVPLLATLQGLKAELDVLRGALFAPLAQYTNTMRGAWSNGDFTRGNTFPATAVPFGFNMWTPVNRDDRNWFYQFYENEASTVVLDKIQAFAVVHEPSPWIGNRQTLQIMPVDPTKPSLTKVGRAEQFQRQNETAKAYYYSLMFNNGTRTEITPTDHAAYFRFTAPANKTDLTVLFDAFSGSVGGTLAADTATNSVSGFTNQNSNGSSDMYFYAEFDKPIAAVTRPSHEPNNGVLRTLKFDTPSGAKSVGMRIATSFISVDQAKANLAKEIGSNSFDDVKRLARAAWDEKFAQVQVEGATETQKTILYSNMYRSFLYPNSAWEDVGGTPTYMSPYTSPAQRKQGKIWVNNGFWDTYRTTWPLYTLLFPKEAGEMLDGFVNGYKDGGWTTRWSGPGYVDSMVATSLDVVLGDAYVKGVRNFDVNAAYDSAVRNATAYSNEGNRGRKGMNKWPFYGYLPTEVSISDPAPGHVAWSLEGNLNDFGIAQMARALGKTDDAAYFDNRAISYANLFDGTSTGTWAGGWFRSKNQAGAFQNGNTNPATWGYGYTEGNAWSYAVLAPQDGQGLANLYGGRDKLKTKLDSFFTTAPGRDGGSYGFVIHEIKEAAEAHRLANVGEYQHSNQTVHHSIYMYNYAGYPAGGQKYLRDVMDKLYFSGFEATGKSTGEGYIGDEDNGEQSAWYVLSAMGFYPVSMGRPEYAIGAPYFPKMTVTMKDAQGNPHQLVINAPDVSATNRYVQSLKLNGQPITRSYLRHEEVAAGGTLDFEMGPQPSSWGTGANDAPTSITTGTEAPKPLVSLLPRGGYQVTSSTTNVAQLGALSNRDSGGTVWSQAAGTPAWIQASKTVTTTSDSVKMYTLTSAAIAGQDPTSWTLKGSSDGTNWVTLDERQSQTFAWRQQVKPFALSTPAAYAHYRLEFAGNAAVSVAEFELLAP